MAAGLIVICLVTAFYGFAAARTKTITGTVRTDDGEPLVYANIILVNTNLGAMSLADGSFTITGVPPGTYTVKALAMGFKFVEKPNINVDGGSPSLSFVLERIRVGAVTRPIYATRDTVSADQLEEMPVGDVLDRIRF